MNDFCGELGKLESLSDIQPPDIQPGDVAGAQTMTAIGTSLQQVDNPLAGINDSPELREAAQQAPNCQNIASGA